MSRLLFTLFFVLGVAVLSFVLWQKQISEYNFSFEQKKNISKNFEEVVRDFEQNLAPFNEALEGARGVDWEQIRTSMRGQSATTSASSTSSEGDAQN